MCDSPIFLHKAGSINKDNKVRQENVFVQCGKCPPCRLKRIQGWVFRLQEEEKVSQSSYFVTLTYDTNTVPMTDTGFMTLKKLDLELYFKSLRHKSLTKIKYYACGEYGSKTYRPHYHIILLNFVGNIEDIEKCWGKGIVHIGTVTQDSIAYTAKYCDKEHTIPRFNGDIRVPEFSRMSKKLGLSFLTPEVEKYFIDNQNYTFQKNEKDYITLPRYFRDRIFTEYDKENINQRIKKEQAEKYNEKEKAYYQTNKHLTYEAYIDYQKQCRKLRAKKKQEQRKDL